MHRRSFTKKLLLTGLAASTVLSGSSIMAFGHEGDNGPPAFDRVTLRLPGATRIISYFAVPTDNGLYGVDLRVEVPQMAAERIDLGNVPLLGQILTPTLNRQFAGATIAGSLHLVENTIVLLPVIALPASRCHVWVTHRKVVYRPPGRLRRLALKMSLTPERVRAARLIGKAVLKDDIILGIVPPSALDTTEFRQAAQA